MVQCRNLISTEYRPKSAIKYEIPHLESQVSSKISCQRKRPHTIQYETNLFSTLGLRLICDLSFVPGTKLRHHIVFSKVPSDSLVSTCFLSVVVSQYKPEPARNDTFLFLFFLCADCFIQIQDDHTWGANLYNTSGLLILGVLNYVLGMLDQGGEEHDKPLLVQISAIEPGPLAT